MPETGIILQIILYYTYVIFARGICECLHFFNTKKDIAMRCPCFVGDPSGTRIPDPLIKSQMLYRLS